MKILGSNGIEFPGGSPFTYYEEGTFTPIISRYAYPNIYSGNSESYNTQSGKYLRIGKVVYFNLRVELSNKGNLTSSNICITGMPFQPLTSGVGRMAVTVASADNVTDYSPDKLIGTFITYIDSKAVIILVDTVTTNAIPCSKLNNNTLLDVAGFYFV